MHQAQSRSSLVEAGIINALALQGAATKAYPVRKSTGFKGT